MKTSLINLLKERKYEIFLLGLLQHLFIGIFFTDLIYYTDVVWAINMIILGLTGIGLFLEKDKWNNYFRILLFIFVLAMPLTISVVPEVDSFMKGVSLLYFLFFALIFYEIIQFLLRPGYINTDIISASACGYLLLIEMSVFFLQFLFYMDPSCISNVSHSDPASTYIDLIYFCTTIQTTIGFGDIAPTAHYTKLLVAFFGIVGQFYSVVLIGILLSKFTSRRS